VSELKPTYRFPKSRSKRLAKAVELARTLFGFSETEDGFRVSPTREEIGGEAFSELLKASEKWKGSGFFLGDNPVSKDEFLQALEPVVESVQKFEPQQEAEPQQEERLQEAEPPKEAEARQEVSHQNGIPNSVAESTQRIDDAIQAEPTNKRKRKGCCCCCWWMPFSFAALISLLLSAISL
jgi:hypothetical protein